MIGDKKQKHVLFLYNIDVSKSSINNNNNKLKLHTEASKAFEFHITRQFNILSKLSVFSMYLIINTIVITTYQVVYNFSNIKLLLEFYNFQ